jgi:quercetin dioxygenase-like cupin family protein
VALHHAKRAELIDLNDWPSGLPAGQSHAIVKTDYMEMARLSLAKAAGVSKHTLSFPVIIQCLKGTVELETVRARQAISAGQLLYLDANDPFALTALRDAEILLTYILAARE